MRAVLCRAVCNTGATFRSLQSGRWCVRLPVAMCGTVPATQSTCDPCCRCEALLGRTPLGTHTHSVGRFPLLDPNVTRYSVACTAQHNEHIPEANGHPLNLPLCCLTHPPPLLPSTQTGFPMLLQAISGAFVSAPDAATAARLLASLLQLTKLSGLLGLDRQCEASVGVLAARCGVFDPAPPGGCTAGQAQWLPLCVTQCLLLTTQAHAQQGTNTRACRRVGWSECVCGALRCM